MSSTTTTSCRRCGTTYAATRAWLPSCPRCGAAPVPLRTRIRDNRAAAVLAIVALAMLAVGLTRPFMTMEKLGDRRSFSLIAGVRQLFDDGYVVIGAVLLVFSLLFPIAKLCAILLATSRLAPLGPRGRHLLHAAADATGKYSMLDLLVVAVIIVIVKFQNLAHVEAQPGTLWFCAAVLTSMLASLCVRVEDR